MCLEIGHILFIYFLNSSSVYHVSTTKIERITTGSSKIEEITQQVVRLRKEDPTVKIVIFSQWSIILANLGEAFSMNGIIYRKDLSHFSDTVREFKVSNATYFIIYITGSISSNSLISSTTFINESF